MGNKIVSDFKNFIKSNNLIPDGSKVLVAVSGGMDSTVLLHLLHRASYSFGIAHCNFGLRGHESDEDEEFVRDLAAHYEIKLYVRKFDKSDFDSPENNSIQMQARELRYNWFKELLEKENFQRIAIAHHKNDNTETIFLNLIKGAVFKGLQGIRPRNGFVIRPLLWISRKEIENYAIENKLAFRTDSSNLSDKYLRNNIRLNILPLIRKINPAVDSTIYQSAIIRQGFSEYFTKHIAELSKKLLQGKETDIIIKYSELKNLNPAIFFSIVEPLGFSYSQCLNLYQTLELTEGKEFLTHTHRLIKQKEEIVIMHLQEETRPVEIKIEHRDKSVNFKDTTIEIDILEPNEVSISRDHTEAMLDLTKLKFPLTLRFWQPGDYFVPLGMKGKKKISDFLTDLHAETLSKENQLVILSSNDIVWLVGRRIDERYKVTSTTKKILKFQLGM